MANKLILTLCIIHQGDKVLLGYKKRGFGMHKWNGFGGKLKPGETIEQAAIRETEEESGLKVLDLKKMGILTFRFSESGELLEGHIYKATKVDGKIIETAEMRPAWFKTDKIPYDKMWSDDIHWIPMFLKNKKFIGEFNFDNKDEIITYTLSEVNKL